MGEEERALRDMIVEATGDRESVLIDPKDPNRVLATEFKKPSTWMRAGGQASLKKNHPEGRSLAAAKTSTPGLPTFA
jgi:hypothetical protein